MRRKGSSEQELMPANLVQNMLGTLSDYTKELPASENDSKAVFERRLQAGAGQLQALHDEYKQLKAAYQTERERQGRLLAAVQHLEKTHQQLLKQEQSLF